MLLPHLPRAGSLLWKKTAEGAPALDHSFLDLSLTAISQAAQKNHLEVEYSLNIFSGKDRHNGVGWSPGGSPF